MIPTKILPAHNPYITLLELPIVSNPWFPLKLVPAHNPYITLLELPLVTIHIQTYDSH